MSSWSTEATTSSHLAQAGLETQMGLRQRDTSSTKGLNFGGFDQSNNALGGMAGGMTVGAALGSRYGIGGTIVGGAVGAIGGGMYGSTQISGYDVVGIVGSQVEPMRTAVREYVAKVQNELKNAIAEATEGMNSAFRGADAQREVLAYLDKVKLYVDNLITQLLSFSDKIADVGNAWIKAQEAIGSNVKTATGNFSEGTAYSDDMVYSGSTSVGAGAVAGAATASATITK